MRRLDHKTLPNDDLIELYLDEVLSNCSSTSELFEWNVFIESFARNKLPFVLHEINDVPCETNDTRTNNVRGNGLLRELSRVTTTSALPIQSRHISHFSPMLYASFRNLRAYLIKRLAEEVTMTCESIEQ